ncbi:hypothetical protein PFICI_03816 [Pestalotiopsis fici W106-1]|uniref:Uncharacterized protein n=1 Tax=Pestalotiopsis fici (strain W106-1 / CGMCC3.15140) TaxID=1229662 RepID=W3XKP1_PESFW|nr:uncharacterized protein PFICI_03816 [Pestalotiopsis fici W106-1]ETS85791.1 hypothetical protein PFICI_03816 [Pestalotiopsis fici W106-1]
MSVDPISLALSTGAIALALKGAIDTALFVESFFDRDMISYGYLETCYSTERVWLQIWRETCNVCENNDGILQEKPEYLKKQVIHILNTVHDLSQDAKKMIDRYQIVAPETSVKDLNKVVKSGHPSQTKNVADLRPNSRVRWIIKGRAEFEQIIRRFREQNRDLERLTLGPGARDGLASRVVSGIPESSLAGFAQGLHIVPKTNIALAASVKALQPSLENQTLTSTQLMGERLKMVGPQSTRDSATGMLSLADGSQAPVWIEWIILEDGQNSNTNAYISRINSLGGLLERVGDPMLHLLPCHGVFRDTNYQQKYGILRLGYVFGVPQGNDYESDLVESPPISLRQLIDGSNDTDNRGRLPRPFLGDRFLLAYDLAASFGLFHAAGWLHKGLHAGSVTFLQRSTQRSSAIELRDPFVTGFQYSRPQSSESLSRGPLENKDLDYYYHPDVGRGFTKRRDLYGLGVILLEIGRWGLIADAVSERNRPQDRQAWHTFLMKKAVPDVGWRMGERYEKVVRVLLECKLPGDEHDKDFYFQQFQERVLEPLSSCSA